MTIQDFFWGGGQGKEEYQGLNLALPLEALCQPDIQAFSYLFLQILPVSSHYTVPKLLPHFQVFVTATFHFTELIF
jgi:hypothetical protein